MNWLSKRGIIRITFKSFLLLTAVALINLTGCQHPGQPDRQPGPDLTGFTKQTVTAEDLSKWDFYGLGKAFNAGGGQFCLMENDTTFGVILISPESYEGDLVVRYNTLALTSSTVLVFMHSVSDRERSDALSIPEDYNGGMGLWINEKNNYFHAFRNAPHNVTPFIRKNPEPGSQQLATAPENVMVPGVNYSVEIGRMGNRLWLSINGERIAEATDEKIYPGGHIALRIRGTAGLKAACLIKELEIYTK